MLQNNVLGLLEVVGKKNYEAMILVSKWKHQGKILGGNFLGGLFLPKNVQKSVTVFPVSVF